MKIMLSMCIGALLVFVSGLPAAGQEVVPRTVNGGVLNGKAVSLPKPIYSESARIAGVPGVVGVNVVIDEGGNVVSAEAAPHYIASAKTADDANSEPVPIDPALGEAAVDAARKAMFSPTLLNGQPVKVKGMIVYNFTNGETESTDGPRVVGGGVLNGKATSLPSPAYPAAAKAVSAQGTVSVRVSIDEEGNVVSAEAVSGHPLLRAAAAQAAREAKFSPTQLSDQPVKVSGILTYNFVLPSKDDQ